jgi:hypothetical protein
MLYVTVHEALASVELFLSPMLTCGPRRHGSKVWNRVELARLACPMGVFRYLSRKRAAVSVSSVYS